MSKARILVVEDEAIVARDISMQLERAGYIRAGVTARGEDAITLVGELKPDLVLMDIMLAGEMDGIVAATRIRELYTTPVVFITAFADTAVLHRAQAAEAFGYIVKPFDERELQPAIEIALHKHRAEAALRRSERRFRRLFNGVRDAVLLADTETGLVLEANDEASRLFGRPRQALIGLHQSALHPPALTRKYLELYAYHAGADTEDPTEAEIITADGRIVPVEINAGLVDLEGDRHALLGVFRDISARREAERAVRERQARLDAIFRAAPAGIGMVINRVITEANHQVCQMSGYSEDELVGRSSRMLYASREEFERVGSAKYGQIAEHGTGTLETQWQRKDGRLFDVLLSSTPIDPANLSAGVTFTAIDITERKRIKAELRQRNQILEGLQRISQVMLDPARDGAAFDRIASEVATMLDLGFASVMLHKPATRTLQLLGLHGFDAGGPSPREVPVRDTHAGLVLERGGPVVEHDIQKHKERLHPGLQRHATAFFAGVPLVIGGHIAGVLAVAHERPCTMESFLLDQLSSIANHIASLVERREAEAARLSSETELLAIYDHAPVIICLLDEDSRIIRANQTAASFAGRRPVDLQGATGGEFLSCLNALSDSRGCGFGPQCATCAMRMTITDTLHNGTSHAQVEVSKSIQRNGRTQDLHMLLSTARIDLDGRRRILVVLEDITENRRLTEHLMRAQRMESIGTLASGIAHDLNNVLAPIVMCLSMLRDTTTDGELIELIDTMQTAARRGADIVRQVLTFARGLGGDRVEIQPKHVIQETARIAHETFPRSIDVTCDFGRELQTFLGDPTQIQQVLMNLCVNARDAMPNGGKLHIRADNTSRVPSDALPAPKERDLGFVVISVTDTGSGMTPEVKDRIFDPFFTTKPIGKGTGLGLAVSIGIIERHGGCMHVESAPDAGTTFRVFLPAATGGPTAGSSARIDETLPHGRGETILVVDDEPSVRTIISGMLERSGYLPIVARDGAEALDRLNDLGDAVRMLITDLMMPGMDGLELIRSVRTTWPGLPIIAMSGLGEDDIRATAEDAGADRVLSKPFTNHTLLRAASDTMNPTTSPRAQSGD